MQDSDGGFAVVAKLFRDRAGNPYIRFHGADDNWKLFMPCEWRGMMWAEIPMPDEARAKWDRHIEAMRRNGAAL